MGIISRPAKQGGFTSYVAKVGAAFTKILDTEADADLDTIYAAWNAGADTVNVKDGAITGPKLATDAVTDVKVAAAAAIAGSKLADNSTDGLKLKNQPDGVRLAKMNIGASLSFLGSAVPTGGPFAGDNVERDVLSFAPLVVRGVGGLVALLGTLGVQLLSVSPASERLVTWNLYGGAAGTIFFDTFGWGVGGSWIGPCPTPIFLTAAISGSNIFRLTLTIDGAGVAAVVNPAKPGKMFAVGLA